MLFCRFFILTCMSIFRPSYFSFLLVYSCTVLIDEYNINVDKKVYNSHKPSPVAILLFTRLELYNLLCQTLFQVTLCLL